MKNSKLYYSISEVSQLTDLEQYVLRYWETEFSQLKPKKNRAGNRIYRDKDIIIVKTIKHLLYVEKYTIAGARNYLKKKGSSSNNTENPKEGKEIQPETSKILEDILKGIDDLLSDIKKAKNS